MHIQDTALPGVKVLTPRRFGDARGFFAETYNAQVLAQAGITTQWVQDNHSLSEAQGTLRGLHFQAPPHGQAKLVRCGQGALFDVAVDIRRSAPTYGQWVGVELSAQNGKQLLIPEGFAHGFVTLQPNTEVIYKCSDFYAPQADGAILWSSLPIAWPMPQSPTGTIGAPILSDKDAAAPAFDQFYSPFS